MNRVDPVFVVRANLVRTRITGCRTLGSGRHGNGESHELLLSDLRDLGVGIAILLVASHQREAGQGSNK